MSGPLPPEFAEPPGFSVARVDAGPRPPAARGRAWIHAAADAVAAALAGPGLGPGPVLIRACDGPAFFAAFLGGVRAGRAALPLGPATPGAAALAAGLGVGAAASIAGDGPMEAPRVEPRAGLRGPRDGQDPLGSGVLLQTSGSTAAAATAYRGVAGLAAVGRACASGLGVTAADHVLSVAPLAHSYGLEHGLLMPLCAGCRVTCAAAPRAPGPWLLAAAERVRPTVLPAVPVLLDRLAREAGSPAAAAGRLRAAGVRLLYSAGGVLPPGLAAAYAAAGLPVGQVFGSTEVGSVTWAPPGEDAGVGRALPGVTLRVDGAGHLRVRSPWALAGFLRGPGRLEAASDAEGFFATGDLASIDASGALRLAGRSRLLVDVGGRKVNPAEVEAALGACPGVAEAVVLPMVQSETITRLRAFVEPAGADAPPAEADLRARLRRTLPPHKIPRRFHALAALPRTPAGKPDRAALSRLADSLP
ncbi:class I adenylate-forming enzyme family protein [Phycisphaera mikurensis]|uniref:Long-chain-fatty-acid--CoA ligase n=1 Tax=Phycisphaera mikurensis (strain NBRC 102666 / KCTC 22515 / FYK2301M01) TaxID=1142394 RepID=I0IAR3_PHYMF|nr:fatty acid--CoA ligase family protein [Phycisphaera mikurensis]MBB6442673.1 acyl-coenzyme A synthetase/AMP-(fatty) acid ligase [Phycisphaera mikurensis]BAM02351.1 putative fatty-acid--CoA ligase [Phycisphaera mikurensis NBRC 102666]